MMQGGLAVNLPSPSLDGEMSVERAIADRRSVRSYGGEPLPLARLSQLLWAAQGITHEGRFRAAPSAGATYPLELFAVAGNMQGLEPGVYRYDVRSHSLELHLAGDQRRRLADAAVKQEFIAYAPLDILICAVFERTTHYYGERGTRYVHLDAGHAAENISLQAVALGLGTIAVGAFDDGQVSTVMSLGDEVEPLYIMPVGVPR